MTFAKTFKDTNYTIVANGWRTDGSPYQCFVCFKDYATSSVSIWSSDDSTSNPANIRWRAFGYLAQGQY